MSLIKNNEMIRRNRIKRFIVLLIVGMCLLGILTAIIYTTYNREKGNIDNAMQQIIDNGIKISAENEVVYTNQCTVNISLENINDYQFKLFVDDIENRILDTKETKVDLQLETEGEHIISVKAFSNNEMITETKKSVYYVIPYQKQFLDEYDNKGIQVHYRDGSSENFDKSYELFKAVGSRYARIDFLWQCIYKNGKYDFSQYDKYIYQMNQDNIKILAIINGFGSLAGTDKKVNTEDEVNGIVEFIDKVIEKYPFIEEFEVLNEVNLISDYKGAYLTSEESKWYIDIVDKITKAHQDKNFTVAGTVIVANNYHDDNMINSNEFYQNLFDNGLYKYQLGYGIHPYCNDQVSNGFLIESLSAHNNMYNAVGGFENVYVTEYGFSVFNNEIDKDEIQAKKIIQQSSILDKYITNGLKVLYNFWDTDNKPTVKNNNYGILTNSYLPKKSYFAMKKYYENTNGAECFGAIKTVDGVNTYVYDKDGKPKIITWAPKDDNIKVAYPNCTAKDIYGNEIQTDEDGNITVAASPIYIDNISREYFYKVISKQLLDEFEKFEYDFKNHIQAVSGLQEKLNEMKQIAENIGTHSEESEIDENTAIKLMETFYELGDSVIEAYQSGEFDVNEQKLSSMLDDLNDVGNSYEDLITITAKTTDSVNLEETNSIIKTAEQMANNVKSLDNVYPSKILSFSQDLYDKASYINGLQEENGIKTGLIVSTNLHSKLLANWAKNFAESYIAKHFSIQENYVLADEYIKNIPIETKVKDLKTQINSSFEYEIKRGSDVLGDDDILATGDVLQLKNTDKQYEIAVAGDLNKDGEVDIKDLVKIRKTILGLTELSGVEEHAADANMDNKDIGINDLVKIRKIILGM